MDDYKANVRRVRQLCTRSYAGLNAGKEEGSRVVEPCIPFRDEAQQHGAEDFERTRSRLKWWTEQVFMTTTKLHLLPSQSEDHLTG